jgi:predicted O-methyltransferase YrrM
MTIVTPDVERYLHETRPAADALLAEMEAHGARDRVPIVAPATGRLLEVLARAAGARRIVEIGTAIGVSALYLARALPAGGELVSFEIDPARHATASDYLARAGLDVRLDLRLQDALEGLRSLDGPFDVAFLDAAKGEYGAYLDATLPLLRPGALVIVDNVLMSGTVASGRAAGHWTDADIATARDVNRRLVESADLLGTVTPVGDGVGIAVRR